MNRSALQSTAANYPYLQGLWAVPMGLMIALAGIANLRDGPPGSWLVAIAGGVLVTCGALTLVIARRYREHYGTVTPRRRRQLRHAAAVVAWVAVLFLGANKHLLWSPAGPSASTPRRSPWPRWPTTRS